MWSRFVIKSTLATRTQWLDVIKDHTPGYKYVCLQELLEKLPAVKEGKILADKMIDNCGTPPGDDGYDDGDDEDDGDDGDV